MEHVEKRRRLECRGEVNLSLEEFASEVSLWDYAELEKVAIIAFFYHATENFKEFSIQNVCQWFAELHFHKPNTSRLRGNLRKSKKFVSGSSNGQFRLHSRELASYEQLYPQLVDHSEDVVVSTAEVLPRALYSNTRPYIKILADEINACYGSNIFDGAAVLMRRLLEILLIHAYEHAQLSSEIKNGASYKSLNEIIDHAKTCKQLALSRDTRDTLDDFRVLGNFSAHKIYYTAKRDDIKKVLLLYRASIEELLYKAGMIT